MALKPSKPTLLTAEALPISKEVFPSLTLTLGHRQLKIWVFIANITNEFILGLNILCIYGASVDLGRQTLRLAGEKVSLWSPGTGPSHCEPVMLVTSPDVKHAQV
jgi:hypothetical protein